MVQYLPSVCQVLGSTAIPRKKETLESLQPCLCWQRKRELSNIADLLTRGLFEAFLLSIKPQASKNIF